MTLASPRLTSHGLNVLSPCGWGGVGLAPTDEVHLAARQSRWHQPALATEVVMSISGLGPVEIPPVSADSIQQ